MQAMPDRVRLTGMRFSATHGVYDFERVEPQLAEESQALWQAMEAGRDA